MAWVVALVAAAFFGFGFALVPLYSTICSVTGLNGRTRDATTASAQADMRRWVTVEFTSTVMPGLPWQFQPEQRRVRVHPGELTMAYYLTTNLSDAALGGQAVMSVTPEAAATHFEKLECFCFTQQALQAHQTRKLPVTFFVTPDLPDDIDTITLSYAFFPVGRPPGADERMPVRTPS